MDGEAIAPMMASVASAIFSSSDSNQRSRIGPAAPVRISNAPGPSRPSLKKRQPSDSRSGAHLAPLPPPSSRLAQHAVVEDTVGVADLPPGINPLDRRSCDY